MSDVIDSTYLPFTKETIAEYLACANGQYRPEGNLLATGYYQQSAAKYQLFTGASENAKVFSLALLRNPRQIEKDERIWTAAALITLDRCGDRWQNWNNVLRKAFGEQPPWIGETWLSLLGDELRLLLEVPMLSPKRYYEWLSKPEHYTAVNPVKYVRDVAAAVFSRPGTRQSPHARLEGATHADALLVSKTGFAVVFEAKVTSDISHSVSFDATRNQIARVLDVILGDRDSKVFKPTTGDPRTWRDPDRTLFALLTPRSFKEEYRYTRLYGWLFDEYKRYGRGGSDLLLKHLPHRNAPGELADIPTRMGWLTYQDCNEILPTNDTHKAPCCWLEGN